VHAYLCSQHYALVYVTRFCEQHVTTALHWVYMNNLLIHSLTILMIESGMYNKRWNERNCLITGA